MRMFYVINTIKFIPMVKKRNKNDLEMKHETNDFNIKSKEMTNNQKENVNCREKDSTVVIKKMDKKHIKSVEIIEKDHLKHKKRKSHSSKNYLKRPLHTNERKKLPIYNWKSRIVSTIEENQVIILVGETGSGKTTQIPQFLYEKNKNYKIAITQPRRVAAINISKRVAKEMGSIVGDTVGYTVRFDNCFNYKTKLKFMTDGMLVREALLSPNLNEYNIIILDEAHERTLQTDILFGIIKNALKYRNKDNFKIIVMSATLDIDLYKSFFNNNKIGILNIPGRQYPVLIKYTKEYQKDYLEATLITILKIHVKDGIYDNKSILVFLTGQDEIETLQELLIQYNKHLPVHSLNMIICPIFSAMPHEQQLKVFEETPNHCRKIILATNIAETSLTIPNVKYVIDPGFVKQKIYIVRKGMEILQIQPISKEQACQRAGRAGREGPGICYRIFPKKNYNDLLDKNIPEIQRVSLEMVILQLKCMGIKNIIKFDYLEKPTKESCIKALEKLFILQALDKEGDITDKGKKMASLPISPMFSVTLLHSIQYNCTYEILSIISMFSVESIFYYPKDEKDKAIIAQNSFHTKEGDHFMYLNIYLQFINCNNKNKKKWCMDHYINYRTMLKVMDIRQQLIEHLNKMNVIINVPIQSPEIMNDLVGKSLVAGFFLNIVKRVPLLLTSSTDKLVSNNNKNCYKIFTNSTNTTNNNGQIVKIHPSSSVFGRNPSPTWLLYNELVYTNNNYIRGITIVKPEWLLEAAPEYFKILHKDE